MKRSLNFAFWELGKKFSFIREKIYGLNSSEVRNFMFFLERVGFLVLHTIPSKEK